MTLRILPLFFLFSLPLFFSCGGEDDTGTFFPDAPANPDQTKLLSLINAARASGYNCSGTKKPAVDDLVWNETLAQVAKAHSEDMSKNNFFSHNGSNGSFPEDRVADAGYVATVSPLENLLKGGATEEEAISAWLNSKEHCVNLLDGDVTEMGVGTSGPYWTLVLSAR
jgi:uncharacterized protein YkwD